MAKNVKDIADEIRGIVSAEETFLMALDVDTVTLPRNRQGRTAKQLLGHLVDSASNNHQRMVRLQYNEVLDFPDYTQHNDLWIALQGYESADWNELVQLWKYLTLHIARIIGAMDEDKLGNRWYDYEGNATTLRDTAEVYVWHLRLHLSEIHSLAGE